MLRIDVREGVVGCGSRSKIGAITAFFHLDAQSLEVYWLHVVGREHS